MNSLDKKLQMSGFIAFFLSGICSISSGIIVSLLQERYGFDYNVTGTLLSIVYYEYWKSDGRFCHRSPSCKDRT